MNRKRKADRKGATAVEFAIAATVLLLIVFASIEFCRLSMLRHSVEYASYLAARKAMIIGARRQDIVDEAELHLQNLGITGGNVNVNPSTITDTTQIVEITVDVPVTGNSWISPVYFGGTLSGRTRMLTDRIASEMAAALPSS